MQSTGIGTPPTVITRPFAGLTSESDGVVNTAVGGHFRIVKGRDLRVHASFATGRSPVGPADQVFSNIDVYSWGVGISGSVGKFQFSGGLNHRAGTAKDVIARNLLNGDLLTSDVDVRTLGFIYAIAYQF